MSDTSTMVYWDGRDREVAREVRHTLDARDFLGTAVYPWLVIAANQHLSAPELELFLTRQSHATPGTARSLSWIKRRRWMAQPPGTSNVGNRDWNHARALQIMAENPKLSVRGLVLVLKDRGITRSREWVRRHRCDPGR